MQSMKKQRRKIEIDLFAVIALFWQKKLVIIASCLVGAVILFMATMLFVTPMYSAEVTMYANNSTSTDKNTSISSQDINASVQLVDTYAAIILSDPVLDQVVQMNGLTITGQSLMDHITISAVNNTEVFKVKVEYLTPEQAAALANTIADVAPAKIASIVDGCSVKVISGAKIPATKSSPDYKKVIAIGGVAGLVASMLFIFIYSLIDTRIKKESDFDAWEYPVIGVIPSFASLQKEDQQHNGKESAKHARA